MRIDVTQVLKTFQGVPMKDQNEKGEAVDATARMAIVNALLYPTQTEKGTDKLTKFELARKVHSTDVVDFSTEDVALIKERVLDVFPTLVAGQVVRILESTDDDGASK